MTEPTPTAKADPTATKVYQNWPCAAPLIRCRFDPTGRFVFAAAEDNALIRREIASGAEAVFRGHESWINFIAFSPDGQTAFTVACDGRLAWWPAASPEAAS